MKKDLYLFLLLFCLISKAFALTGEEVIGMNATQINGMNSSQVNQAINALKTLSGGHYIPNSRHPHSCEIILRRCWLLEKRSGSRPGVCAGRLASRCSGNDPVTNRPFESLADGVAAEATPPEPEPELEPELPSHQASSCINDSLEAFSDWLGNDEHQGDPDFLEYLDVRMQATAYKLARLQNQLRLQPSGQPAEQIVNNMRSQIPENLQQAFSQSQSYLRDLFSSMQGEANSTNNHQFIRSLQNIASISPESIQILNYLPQPEGVFWNLNERQQSMVHFNPDDTFILNHFRGGTEGEEVSPNHQILQKLNYFSQRNPASRVEDLRYIERMIRTLNIGHVGDLPLMEGEHNPFFRGASDARGTGMMPFRNLSELSSVILGKMNCQGENAQAAPTCDDLGNGDFVIRLTGGETVRDLLRDVASASGDDPERATELNATHARISSALDEPVGRFRYRGQQYSLRLEGRRSGDTYVVRAIINQLNPQGEIGSGCVPPTEEFRSQLQSQAREQALSQFPFNCGRRDLNLGEMTPEQIQIMLNSIPDRTALEAIKQEGRRSNNYQAVANCRQHFRTASNNRSLPAETRAALRRAVSTIYAARIVGRIRPIDAPPLPEVEVPDCMPGQGGPGRTLSEEDIGAAGELRWTYNPDNQGFADHGLISLRHIPEDQELPNVTITAFYRGAMASFNPRLGGAPRPGDTVPGTNGEGTEEVPMGLEPEITPNDISDVSYTIELEETSEPPSENVTVLATVTRTLGGTSEPFSGGVLTWRLGDAPEVQGTNSYSFERPTQEQTLTATFIFSPNGENVRREATLTISPRSASQEEGEGNADEDGDETTGEDQDGDDVPVVPEIDPIGIDESTTSSNSENPSDGIPRLPNIEPGRGRIRGAGDIFGPGMPTPPQPQLNPLPRAAPTRIITIPHY